MSGGVQGSGGPSGAPWRKLVAGPWPWRRVLRVVTFATWAVTAAVFVLRQGLTWWLFVPWVVVSFVATVVQWVDWWNHRRQAQAATAAASGPVPVVRSRQDDHERGRQ